MDDSAFENPFVRKGRLLTQMLILSVALNIGLLSTLIYRSLSVSVDEEIVVTAPIAKQTNIEVIDSFLQSTYEDLIGELENVELLQDGYTKRDIALSCLVNFHYFDIDRALSGIDTQKRVISFVNKEGGEQFDLTVFPGLGDQHFYSLKIFAKREKWPVTSEGLFYELKNLKQPPDDLLEAFYLSQPFYRAYSLFAQLDPKPSREQVVRLLSEGEWGEVQSLLDGPACDINMQNLRALLSKNLGENRSQLAAFWIEYDEDYVFRWLNDQQMIELITSLTDQSIKTKNFLRRFLTSARSDEVRFLAGKKLFELDGQKVPSPYDHSLAISRFLGIKQEEEPKKEIEQTTHIVSSGESLWKISRRYHVDLDELIKINNLKAKTKLKIGQRLIIPRLLHQDAKDDI